MRYFILALTTMAAVLLYLDRFCISFAERYIKEDLNLSNQQIGWVLSAFFWTYALAQVPAGFLTDRFGARITLTLYILLWSLFTALTGLATGILMLLVWRFGFGLAQAGTYPASGSLIGKWVPSSERGFASSLVAFGGRVGGFTAPMLTAVLIVALMPADTPSLLTTDDILDYPELCYRLTEADKTNGDVFLANMSGGFQKTVAGLGGEVKIRKDLAKAKEPMSQTALVYAQDDVPVMVRGLNQALKRADLVAAVSLEYTPLPAEAETLREKSPGSLTAEEIERRNRLVLEALFPQGIKKLYVQGWRPAMLVFGLGGMVVAAVFWFGFRDRPAMHPLCNEAEVQLIEASTASAAQGQKSRVPFWQLISSASMWMMCLSQMGTNVGWLFLVTWLPRYLDEMHRVPIGERGVLVALPSLAMWLGMLLGGGFTDWIARRVGLRWSRALPIALTRFAAMAAYLICLVYGDLWIVMTAFCLVAFFCDFGIPPMWAFALDVGGRNVGSVLGWGNMWGNFGAAITPPLLIWVVGDQQWDRAFMVAAFGFFVSGLAALGIDASKPIAAKETSA